LLLATTYQQSSLVRQTTCWKAAKWAHRGWTPLHLHRPIESCADAVYLVYNKKKSQLCAALRGGGEAQQYLALFLVAASRRAFLCDVGHGRTLQKMAVTWPRGYGFFLRLAPLYALCMLPSQSVLFAQDLSTSYHEKATMESDEDLQHDLEEERSISMTISDLAETPTASVNSSFFAPLFSPGKSIAAVSPPSAGAAVGHSNGLDFGNSTPRTLFRHSPANVNGQPLSTPQQARHLSGGSSVKDTFKVLRLHNNK